MARIALQCVIEDAAPVRPPGFNIWEGPSRHDKAPIVCIITGFVNKSENPKTGQMLQTWVLRQDICPAEAVKTGDDASVCNNCSLRPLNRGVDDEHDKMCYVKTHFAPQQIWRSYTAGTYPTISRKLLAEKLIGRRVRLGAYGNMSNCPYWLTQLLAKHSDGHTSYDHNWAAIPQSFAQFAMASVATEKEYRHAKRLGWRTFRVKSPDDPVLPNERECPAQDKFRQEGRKVQCISCMACHGTNGKAGLVDLVIDDHGPTSPKALEHIRSLHEKMRLERLNRS